MQLLSDSRQSVANRTLSAMRRSQPALVEGKKILLGLSTQGVAVSVGEAVTVGAGVASDGLGVGVGVETGSEGMGVTLGEVLGVVLGVPLVGPPPSIIVHAWAADG